MGNDAPTLLEITQLTLQELTHTQEIDRIRECGRAALALLPTDFDLALKLAYQKLHDVPYKEVKTCWRRLYVDASLWKVVKAVDTQPSQLSTTGSDEQRGNTEEGSAWVDEVVRILDMTLILTGAPQREELVELWFAALKAVLTPLGRNCSVDVDTSEPPCKKRKLSFSHQSSRTPARFLTALPDPSPSLRHAIPRTKELSLEAFQKRVGDADVHTPVIIEGAIQHWPALEERPWNNPDYLLEQTLGGRRLIPVEVGKSYTDESWGQRITTFRDFMETYMLDGRAEVVSTTTHNDGVNGPDLDGTHGSETPTSTPTGYLAQHDLFAQIPSLRADISIPDYCYVEPAPSPHLTHVKPVPKLEEPLLNAWFGPTGTVSPLHTDPYHNILAQVVGYKYVRLYAPEETKRLYPRGMEGGGVDMSNTSRVDLDEGMGVLPEMSCWEGEEVSSERRREFEEEFPDFKNAQYIEVWEDISEREKKESSESELILKRGPSFYSNAPWLASHLIVYLFSIYSTNAPFPNGTPIAYTPSPTRSIPSHPLPSPFPSPKSRTNSIPDNQLLALPKTTPQIPHPLI
ncbi:lysine-specific demethylase 8 [Alternaria panax]|uniref:Lysine-specific demethylase 8 n=1 Tax=Alternaria panax TaxID=48097 RepID=A0AAD4I7N8_9PLEO|nr:lysine-specific demethylase 8 [Alternaria panax]